MDLHTIQVTATGITPLLMSSPKAMQAEGGTVAVGKKDILSPEASAESRAYRQPDGTLFFPTVAFRSSMLRAATGERIGKRAARSVLAGAVFVVEERAPLFDPATGDPASTYEIDNRRVVVSRGSGIVRSRPRLETWAATFQLDVDVDILTDAAADIVAHYLTIAGSSIGVGDYRPEKAGPFGRYTIDITETQ